jgi:hypothetical protein
VLRVFTFVSTLSCLCTATGQTQRLPQAKSQIYSVSPATGYQPVEQLATDDCCLASTLCKNVSGTGKGSMQR